jgi:hypothetical protein
MLRVEQMVKADYQDALLGATGRGLPFGGGIYDALHTAVARRFAVAEVFTYNFSNFVLHAPDLKISVP